MGILQQFHGSGHILEYDLAEEMNHGIYVSNLVYDVAGEMGLPEEQKQELAVAGMLHDIGKLELTGYINGTKTMLVEEMRYVRMHSKLSYEFLKERGYSHFILQSILYHHENYDGSGYPDNLSGKEIPLGARIIRVCDVFAALTSDRPYRKSFDMETAIELMIDEIKNFDMEIFLAFQKVAHRVGLQYKTNPIKGEEE